MTMSQINKRVVPRISLQPNKKIKLSLEDSDAVDIDPTRFIVSAFRNNGFDCAKVKDEAESQLLKLTPTMVEAYDMTVSKAVRDDDLSTLRNLHEAGAILDCCNKFGDSLIHIACRRGHTRIVKFLVEEARVHVHRVDDLKRTPLHDACWTHEPKFEIVDMLLRKAPIQAVCRDSRGHTPFDYARKHHRAQWLKFLSERRHLMKLSVAKTRIVQTTDPSSLGP